MNPIGKALFFASMVFATVAVPANAKFPDW